MAITRIGNPAIADQRGINFRNIIINGDMSIAQRGTSFSASSSAIYTLDRFKYINVDTPDNVYTITQDTDVPSGQGFTKSLKVDVATADASLDSSDGTQIEHRVEAQNLQYLNFGNSSAKSLTLSFWVKSNKTGTYVVRLLQPDASSRMVSYAYTISSASTWEKKTINITGDTGGTINNDNGNGLNITWWLSAGTDYQSGSLASTWQSYSNGDSAVGQVNLADSTSNEWYITGVQLEAGTTASDFEFLPRDISLQRCHRYCYKTPTGSLSENQAEYCNAHHYAANLILGLCSVNPVEMRVPFTVTFSGSFESYGASSVITMNSLSSNEITTRGFQINGTPATNRTPGQAVTIRNQTNTTAFILQEAEL